MKYEMNTCPYCGSDDIEREKTHDKYHCKECDWLFDEEDVEREDIRHKVFALLNNTSEEHPMECDIIVGEHEAQGLSGLELPNIVKAFEMEGDGTMWFYVDGSVTRDVITGELVDYWMNFDDFDIYDLREILKGLQDGTENNS